VASILPTFPFPSCRQTYIRYVRRQAARQTDPTPNCGDGIPIPIVITHGKPCPKLVGTLRPAASIYICAREEEERDNGKMGGGGRVATRFNRERGLPPVFPHPGVSAIHDIGTSRLPWAGRLFTGFRSRLRSDPSPANAPHTLDTQYTRASQDAMDALVIA